MLAKFRWANGGEVHMTYIAVIEGISGAQRYLERGRETPEEKKARRFRSEESAKAAAEAHINAFPPVVRRQMKFEVRPA